MEGIGFGVDLIPADAGQLFEIIVAGDYDTFAWGWVPFVDPSPMLSYFTSDELGNYNDANWSDPEYDALYTQQNEELDPAVRRDLVHQMLQILYDASIYIPIEYAPDLQAYRTDRFEGWIKQPAEIGPVMFSNTSPSYFSLTPIGGAGGGGTNWTAIAIGAAVVLIGGGVAFAAAKRRGTTADERE
jgi:peptide/nickel transport system substrate-binding protein